MILKKRQPFKSCVDKICEILLYNSQSQIIFYYNLQIWPFTFLSWQPCNCVTYALLHKWNSLSLSQDYKDFKSSIFFPITFLKQTSKNDCLVSLFFNITITSILHLQYLIRFGQHLIKVIEYCVFFKAHFIKYVSNIVVGK